MKIYDKIFEGFNSELFHATRIWSFQSILRSNALNASIASMEKKDRKSSYKYYISTARSIYSDYIFDLTETEPFFVILVLDRKKLANNYKISPFNYFTLNSGYSRLDEYEDRIHLNSSSIPNISDYIIEVRFIRTIHLEYPKVDSRFVPSAHLAALDAINAGLSCKFFLWRGQTPKPITSGEYFKGVI
jgi:hypothetical protein